MAKINKGRYSADLGADGKVLFRERDFTANATLRPIGNAAGEERSLDGPIFADLAAQIREAATTAW